MFNTSVCFATVNELSTCCINQFDNSLHVEIVYYFSLLSTSIRAITKHTFDALNHHFCKSLNNTFVDE
jgi:hypothetical protein